LATRPDPNSASQRNVVNHRRRRAISSSHFKIALNSHLSVGRRRGKSLSSFSLLRRLDQVFGSGLLNPCGSGIITITIGASAARRLRRRRRRRHRRSGDFSVVRSLQDRSGEQRESSLMQSGRGRRSVGRRADLCLRLSPRSRGKDPGTGETDGQVERLARSSSVGRLVRSDEGELRVDDDDVDVTRTDTEVRDAMG